MVEQTITTSYLPLPDVQWPSNARQTRRSRALFLMVGQAPEAHRTVRTVRRYTHGNDVPGLRVLARRAHAGGFLKKRIKMGGGGVRFYIICIDETSLQAFMVRKYCRSPLGKQCTINTHSQEVFKKYPLTVL
mgnify:CR=1 FL=1